MIQLLQTIGERGAWEGSNRSLAKGHWGGANTVAKGGKSGKYLQWKAPLLAYLRLVVDYRIDTWVRWRLTQKEVINADAIEVEFGPDASQVNRFSSLLHSELAMYVRSPVHYIQIRVQHNGTISKQCVGHVQIRAQDRPVNTKHQAV